MKNSWANDDGGGISLCSIDAGCAAQAILDNGQTKWNALKYSVNTMLYKDALATDAKLSGKGGNNSSGSVMSQEDKDKAAKKAKNSLLLVAGGGLLLIGIVGVIMYNTAKTAK